MEQVLTLDDVCALLKISTRTGRNRLSQGLPMPPSFRNGRRRLFLASLVEAWLRGQAGLEDMSDPVQLVPRRGRPRNTETGGLA